MNQISQWQNRIKFGLLNYMIVLRNTICWAMIELNQIAKLNRSLHSLLLLPEHAHTTFHCVLTCSSYKYLNELSLQHCCVILCILFEQGFYFCLLCVTHFHLFSHTIYTGGFHWSYWCGPSYSSFWLLLLWGTQQCFCQPLNHLLITIDTFFSYQLSSSFPWWIVHAFIFPPTFLLVFYIFYPISFLHFLSPIHFLSRSFSY